MQALSAAPTTGLTLGEAPRQLGRYELLRPIASGGMATVYLGRLRGAAGFERLYAVKCCHPHLRQDRDFAVMFMDEARIAARIHHPNVVPTLDVGEDLVLYLVMDYVQGGSLSSIIKALRAKGTRGLPSPIALRIVVDALNGLHAAHELVGADGSPLGLVHRDVSPPNILVGVDGVARITDFGVAKAASRLTHTDSGIMKGKLGYMAPEQLQQGTIDRRADVFAAGVVLWEALTGKRLFFGERPADTIHRVLKSEIREPSRVKEDVPEEVDSLVLHALARDPECRFQTAIDLVESIESSGAPIASARQVGAFVRQTLETELNQAEAIVREAVTAAATHADGDPTRLAPDGSSAPGRSRRKLWSLLATVIVVAGVSTWWTLGQRNQATMRALPLPLPAAEEIAPAVEMAPNPETPPTTTHTDTPSADEDEGAARATGNQLGSARAETEITKKTQSAAAKTTRRKRRRRRAKGPSTASGSSKGSGEFRPSGL